MVVSNSREYLAQGLGSGVEMTFVLIPAGQFMMGSSDSEAGRYDNEGPQHMVTISRPFYMGITEVTQAQWRAVMNTTPWEDKQNIKAENDAAASYISWYDAKAFCNAMSEMNGHMVRLPTEAEWEYACRAGTTTRFYYGDDLNYRELDKYAWYEGNSWDKGQWYAHSVDLKRPNPWGLYDMHGNVEEWCNDWYADSYAEADTCDPKGATSGEDHVLRGGSWVIPPRRCRGAIRDKHSPGFKYYGIGFRIVVEVE